MLLALKFFLKETDASTSFTIASLSAVHDAILNVASEAHTIFFNFIFLTVLDGTFFFDGCLAFLFRNKGRRFFYTSKRKCDLFFRMTSVFIKKKVFFNSLYMVLLFCFRFFVELIKMPTLLFALNVNWVKRLKTGAASLSFHQE